ncbi:hypothetical protein BH23VER1_BH23VER1_03610 [soil metagenome]
MSPRQPIAAALPAGIFAILVFVAVNETDRQPPARPAPPPPRIGEAAEDRQAATPSSSHRPSWNAPTIALPVTAVGTCRVIENRRTGNARRGTLVSIPDGQPDARVVVAWRNDRWMATTHGLVTGDYEIQGTGNGTPTVTSASAGLDCATTHHGDADADGLVDEPAPPAAPAAPDADGITVLDTLVVFNESARIALGGSAANPADDDAIRLKIASSVAAANSAYADSEIPIALRLLFAGPVDYPYPTTENFSRALSELTVSDDGKLDAVEQLRDAYGADIVSLWLSSDTSGGLARVIRPLTLRFRSAFSVVRAENPVTTFVHEVGHNLGCRHLESSYATTPTSWFPDSFAHFFTTPSGRKYVTLMASTSDINTTGADARILRFSDPSLTYEEGVTGSTGQSDCARTLRASGPREAQFFPFSPGALHVVPLASGSSLSMEGAFPNRSYAIERSAGLDGWSPLDISLTTSESGDSTSPATVPGTPVPLSVDSFFRATLEPQ